MAVFTRTCFCLPLSWGAIATFVFSTVISLIPLTSLPHFISKIRLENLILNCCQIAFAAFTGVFALIGAIQKQPNFVLPFLSFYIGYSIIDFVSIVGTILIGQPFYGHDLLKGGGMAQKQYSKIYVNILIIYFTIILALRVYFTLIVYSFYDELHNSIKESESSEDNNEMGALSNSSNTSSSMELDI